MKTAILPALALVSIGCGTSGNAAAPGDGGRGHDASTQDVRHDSAAKLDTGKIPDSNRATDSQQSPDAGGTHTVMFSYTPEWTGATAVTVIGGFGQATDWTMPFLTLTSDGSGGFKGTAQLPSGTYLYVFHVTGDSAGAVPATYTRYVVDPTDPAFALCPSASPTYGADPNPCSQLTVPQPAAAPLYHITGTVTYDGSPKAGYLVLLERDEPSSHHFPANRTTSAADGSFDVEMAPGTYRLQVQYPTFLSQTDAQRDPLTLLAVRRSLSSPEPITADRSFSSVEVAYHDYDKMAPIDGGAKLPQTFNYTIIAGATEGYLAVYGPGANIGDPWYSTHASTATSGVFDGGFNTAQATQTAVMPGTKYAWGTWQVGPTLDGGVKWTGESMVFPVTF